MKTTSILINENGIVMASVERKPELCQACGGDGYTVGWKMGSDHGCCGVPNRDGSCCGNAIEVPVQIPVQEQCQCGGYQSALTRFNASYREFEDQRIVQGYLPDSAFIRTDTDESALIPNTELELAVEVKEIWKFRDTSTGEVWCEVGEKEIGKQHHRPGFEYKLVYRIVD